MAIKNEFILNDYNSMSNLNNWFDYKQSSLTHLISFSNNSLVFSNVNYFS